MSHVVPDPGPEDHQGPGPLRILWWAAIGFGTAPYGGDHQKGIVTLPRRHPKCLSGEFQPLDSRSLTVLR